MGKNNKRPGGGFNSKKPSFLQSGSKQAKKSDKDAQQADDGSSDLSSGDDNHIQQQLASSIDNKRKEKQQNKERIAQSRIEGLPTGITSEDIIKFNELLKKHGDANQNKEFVRKVEEGAIGKAMAQKADKPVEFKGEFKVLRFDLGG